MQCCSSFAAAMMAALPTPTGRKACCCQMPHSADMQCAWLAELRRQGGWRAQVAATSARPCWRRARPSPRACAWASWPARSARTSCTPSSACCSAPRAATCSSSSPAWEPSLTPPQPRRSRRPSLWCSLPGSAPAQRFSRCDHSSSLEDLSPHMQAHAWQSSSQAQRLWHNGGLHHDGTCHVWASALFTRQHVKMLGL